jgi:hypothetical protein
LGSVRLAYLHTNRLLIKLYKQETEICCRKDNGFIKTQTDIHRHGPVQPSNICQLLDPPHFSLVTTFKEFYSRFTIYFIICGTYISYRVREVQHLVEGKTKKFVSNQTESCRIESAL